MRVWIDVVTPKQALFFHPLAAELRKAGHQVYATARRYREVEELAKLIGFGVDSIGAHGGGSRYGKLMASAQRVRLLAEKVSDFAPDCAVSFSSPECARVAFGLAVPHVCVNDSPHAESVARLTVPLSAALTTPWIIPYHEWTRYGIGRKRITRYRALDPAAWIRRRAHGNAEPSYFNLDPAKRTITVRLEESFASYLLGTDLSSTEALLEGIARNFGDCNVVVLGRYAEQVAAVEKRFGSTFIVPKKVVDGLQLLDVTDVFVGMGGTMTAEACLLGVPAISGYPGESYLVESYLIRRGLLIRPNTLDDAFRVIRRFLSAKAKQLQRAKAASVLAQMEDPIAKVRSVVERLPMRA